MTVTRAGSERLDLPAQTSNISSSGVLFSSERALGIGPIEYTVDLDSRADFSLTLRCQGKVVRLGAGDPIGFEVAATLERYEFCRQNP